MSGIVDSYGFLFAKASQKLHELLNPILEKEEITPKQMGLLLILEENPGITQKEAGIIQQIDRTTMTKLIDSLEKKGYAKRVSPSNDRRAYGLFLTKQGISKVANLWSSIYLAQDKLFAKLSKQQVSHLQEILQMIIADE